MQITNKLKVKVRDLQTCIAKIAIKKQIPNNELVSITNSQFCSIGKIKYWKEKLKNDPLNTREFQGGARNWLFGKPEYEDSIKSELAKNNPFKTCTFFLKKQICIFLNNLYIYIFIGDWFARKLNEYFFHDIQELKPPYNEKTITKEYVESLFHSMNYTVKKIFAVDKRKFEKKNLEYYDEYVKLIKKINHSSLVFMDESSFDVRQFKKIKIWGPRGEKKFFTDNLGIKHER